MVQTEEKLYLVSLKLINKILLIFFFLKKNNIETFQQNKTHKQQQRGKILKLP